MNILSDPIAVKNLQALCVFGLDGKLYGLSNGVQSEKPITGNKNKSGYCLHCFKWEGKYHTVPVHRLVWAMNNGPIPDGMVIDHIDRVRDNNHPANLRLATKLQNSFNRETNNFNTGKSRNIEQKHSRRLKYNGTLKKYVPENSSYRAYVSSSGKIYHSEWFDTLEEAQGALEVLRATHHGEFAYCPR